ncbi:MAG: UDP-N-acetylmuramate dehydrogenase [Vulcanimicrobiota bacterium]
MGGDSRPEYGSINVINMSSLEEILKTNVRLSSYTTFGIGGPADFFINARSVKSLICGIKFARSRNLPFIVIGGGSNLLIDDRGIRGLVIRNSLKGIRVRKNNLTARAGEKLCRLLQFAANRGLSGLEFAAGIPGTLGGAVFGNAGAYGKALGDFLTEATLMDYNGNVKKVKNEYFNFSYRWSQIKRKREIVLDCTFSLGRGKPDDIKRQMNRLIEERCRKHPDKTWGCAGSYFKNIDPEKPGQRRVAAGLLLDRVGARKMRLGKARVFPGHANFLTNPGGATATEIKELAKILKNKVKQEFGIELEEEVIFLDENLSYI